MDDLIRKRDKFLADAEDCALIARLAANPTKRETFETLSAQLRRMADLVERALGRIKPRGQP